MANVKQPYGPWTKQMFTLLRQKGGLKVEAFSAWLFERNIRVDRTLISHWMNGRTHLPADMLVRLSEFTRRSDLVFGEYLRALGCELVEINLNVPKGRDIIEMMLEAGATLGRLQQALIQALSPDSPGGKEITDGEYQELREQLDAFISQLTGLRALLIQKEGKCRK